MSKIYIADLMASGIILDFSLCKLSKMCSSVHQISCYRKELVLLDIAEVAPHLNAKMSKTVNHTYSNTSAFCLWHHLTLEDSSLNLG